MTILVTAHAWYGGLIGGSFRLATEFAEYLAAQGHDTQVLSSITESADVPTGVCPLPAE